MATPSPQKEKAIGKVKDWIDQFIIEHDICPFASYSMDKNQLKFYVSEAQNVETGLLDMSSYLRKLSFAEKKETTNAICIFDQWEISFLSFIDFYYLSFDLIEDMRLENEFQLIAFHPDYVFEGESEDAHSHFTNRSPYPLIHIVRVDEMENAIKSYGDTSAIYKRNIEYLNEMSEEELKKWDKKKNSK